MMHIELKKELAKRGVRNPHTRSGLKTRSSYDLVHIPVKKLVARLGLDAFDVPAPLKEDGFVTNRVELPLKQNIGAPSVPVVKSGDVVKEGDLVAAVPQNARGAALHASIGGTVRVTDSAVVIEA